MNYLVPEAYMKRLIMNSFSTDAQLMAMCAGEDISDGVQDYIDGYNTGHDTNFATLEECVNDFIDILVDEETISIMPDA